MRDAHEPGAARDAERRSKRSRRTHALVVRQAKTHDLAGTVPSKRCGQARECARIQRVLHARRRDDHPDIDAGIAGGGAGLVDDDLKRRGDAADVGRVGRGIGLDLHAHRALGGVVLGGLADQAAHRGLGAHEVARGIVGALETEPPAPVGRHGCRVDVQ